MSLNDDAIIKVFEECKSKGLTYYDATQKLLQAGYSKQEIINVSYYYKYSAAELDEHPIDKNQVLDAMLAEAAIKEQSIDRLERKMDIDILRSQHPNPRFGTIRGIISIFSWAKFNSSKHNIPKSKIYRAYATAVIGFNLLVYISANILARTRLPMFLMIVFIILSFFLVQYCLARYLNSK